MFKSTIILAALAASPVAAQTPTATPVSPVTLSADTPIATIMADPAGKAVLAKDLPSLAANPNFDQFKGLSLRQLAQYSNGALREERIKQVDADLKAIKAK